MKRVSLIAAALPAVAGLALPAAANPAMAATHGPSNEGSHSVKSVNLGHLSPPATHAAQPDFPKSYSKVGHNGHTKFIMYYSGNTVDSAETITNHGTNAYQETVYLGYGTPYHGATNAWKHWTGTWSGWDGHNWVPACSFSKGASIYGYGYDHKSSTPGYIFPGGPIYVSAHACG